MAGRAGSMATGVQFMNKARTYGTQRNFYIILHASWSGRVLYIADLLPVTKALSYCIYTSKRRWSSKLRLPRA